MQSKHTYFATYSELMDDFCRMPGTPCNCMVPRIKQRTKIAILGYIGTGKTSIIHRIIDMSTMKLINMEVNTDGSVYNVETGNMALDIIEISSKDGNYDDILSSELAREAVATSDIFILVYAVDDFHSFEYLSVLKDAINEAEGNNVPIIQVIGNKIDSDRREVLYELADCTVSIDWELKYTEISAKTDNGVCALLPSLIFPEMLNCYPFKSVINNKNNQTRGKKPLLRRNSEMCIGMNVGCNKNNGTALSAYLSTTNLQRKRNSLIPKTVPLLGMQTKPKSGMKTSNSGVFLSLKACLCAQSPDLNSEYRRIK